VSDPRPTPDECYGSAARILRNAEGCLDREMMDKLDSIARSWMALGAMVEDGDEHSYN